MPQPQETEQAAARLQALYERTQRSLLDRIDVAVRGHRPRSQLRAMLGHVDRDLDALRTGTANWLRTDLPAVYEIGAVDAADTIDTDFRWTRIHRQVVQALATETWIDVADTLQGVDTTTRQTIRGLLNEATRRQLVDGLPPRRAGTDFLAALQAGTGLATVTYANGARHSLADYADTVARTAAARAHNAGALTVCRDEGVAWVEVTDGADCGLTSHQDPRKANGLVLPLDEAMQHPLGHPRCQRAWTPRPDVTSARAARRARRYTDDEQATMAAEDTRGRNLGGERAGYYSTDRAAARARRRQRTARQPRRPRTPRL